MVNERTLMMEGTDAALPPVSAAPASSFEEAVERRARSLLNAAARATVSCRDRFDNQNSI